ncbi:MAG TPA: Gfo/Idh/MocA family oxidoreductase [Chthoniobacteraceae bacterium]|nr:Gfo/Idh/MocA family oxidoreductase [Chthoniobacteraceae bacterium]
MNHAEPKPETQRPRLGFLGLGYIGRKRLEAIVAEDIAEIVAIADPAEELLGHTAAAVPEARQLSELSQLLDLDLDGVVIATPSALHAEQTIAALRKGCAVFCQKPLGRDAGEVGEIITTARDADRLLGVDLSYRHVRGLVAIRELIQSGALGDIFSAELIFHNAYGPDKPWFYDPRLSGGGCVVDLGIHLVDAALWALNTSVTGVSSRVLAQGKPLSPDHEVVEDFATARLDLANGAVAQLACSWRLHAGRPAVIEAAFYGTHGGASLCNVGGSYTEFRADRFIGTNSESLAEPPDEWGGRAAVAWTRQLAENRRFDPEIERQIEVATVLDAIYGRASAGPLLEAGRR